MSPKSIYRRQNRPGSGPDDRFQQVSINNCFSDKNLITTGVPQGSVLGPLVFLIYINGLPSISTKLKKNLFADDTDIFSESSNLESIELTMDKELKKLSSWLITNRLALNISKTNFVIFSPKNKPLETITLIMNRQAIAQKEYVKYLGILIDSKLTFQFHITGVTKKISMAIGLMYKLRHYVCKKIIISIDYSLIYPFLIYAIPIWCASDNIYIKPLLILQKRIVRLLTFNDNYPVPAGPLVHTTPLFYDPSNPRYI